MIRRPYAIGAALAASTLLIAALAGMTYLTLSIERRAEERAVHEENVRIALWRMDAALAELLALENARPVAEYRTQVAFRRSRPFGEDGESRDRLSDTAVIHARFEIDSSGVIEAVPALDGPPRWVFALGAWSPKWDPGDTAEERASRNASENSRTPPAKDPWEALRDVPGGLADRVNTGVNESGQQANFTQDQLNALNVERRQTLAGQASFISAGSEKANLSAPLEARWEEGELLLMRHTITDGLAKRQGTWLDWPALRAALLVEVEDVLPNAELMPVEGNADPERGLVLLPALLEPGEMPEVLLPRWSPARTSLAFVWVAALLCLAGLAALLTGALRLSRRRADFVSAVTHELRTPLTTFRLYSGMLADDMVQDDQRAEYLATLRREGDRLGTLVDNVLAYSRLERRGASARITSVPLTELLNQVIPTLEERAQRGGATLVAGAPREHGTLSVLADSSMVEQILLNLVDNACKYGRDPLQPTIHLDTEPRGSKVVLRIRDHGPGIADADQRRLFLPFHRSAEHAAGGQPGVGLGLALSRRLARATGGTLRLAGGPGARFELELPVD